MDNFDSILNSRVLGALRELERALIRCVRGGVECFYTANDEPHIHRLWHLPTDVTPEECIRAEMERLLARTEALVGQLTSTFARDPTGDYNRVVRDLLEQYRVFLDHASVVLSGSLPSAQSLGPVVRGVEVIRRLLAHDPHSAASDLPTDISASLLRIVMQNVAGLRLRGRKVFSELRTLVAASRSAGSDVRVALIDYEMFLDEQLLERADTSILAEPRSVLDVIDILGMEGPRSSLASVASELADIRYASATVPFAELQREGEALQLAAFVAEATLERNEVTDRTIRECQTIGLLLRNTAIALAHSFGPTRKMVSTVCVP